MFFDEFDEAVDGFVYMSEQVHRELEAYTAAPALFSPHPLFENFGERVDRREACVRLGLDPACRYVLFFGLVRDYKGLDLLLDAWALLRRAGRTAGRRLIVGVSAHDSEQARLAEAGGADYLGAGAVFGSATKTDATPLSYAGLQAVCRAVRIPVVAIGGVNARNILQLQGSGAAGAAVVSALFGAPDITAAARELRALADAMAQDS